MCRHGLLSRKENHIELSAASTPSDIQADTFTGHQMCKHMVLLVSVESKQRATAEASERSLNQTAIWRRQAENRFYCKPIAVAIL